MFGHFGKPYDKEHFVLKEGGKVLFRSLELNDVFLHIGDLTGATALDVDGPPEDEPDAVIAIYPKNSARIFTVYMEERWIQ